MEDNSATKDALLVNLILIFKNAAMQQMGKIVNPLSGKVEKNLEQARFSIDIIEMLKDKTAGNLSSELGRLLDSTLLELRMNYIEEAKATEQTGEGSEEGKTTRQDADKSDATAEAPDGT